ncbi:sialate O-acetylesterase [Hymenobacter sp. BT491]|uniref:sialate O-acetylesterase n=1 Tax=Hymenobacter sp. BT491 TaxID=2766779 RepID=UPI001653667D|nr:sialate O-acetylesterase [Hymenobacter sp. BT491]MBC6992389.1 sialate O-acetylesterase [Hymenobacter sp. BT491]
MKNPTSFGNRLRCAGSLLVACGLLLPPRPVAAQIRLPRLISDGMILQRDAKVSIWGWAAAGEAVTVKFSGQTYRATTGPDGKWTIALPALKAGGPYEMNLDASNHLTVKDILVGDVWVCSGQSNMETPMSRVRDRYPDAVAQANNPMIRQFNVDLRYAFNGPKADLAGGRWVTTTPQNVLAFSAVGYFFAKTLFEKYHVPVGIIKSAVGGSPAEAWLSADALKAFPAYQQAAEKVKDSTYVARTIAQDQAASRMWYTNLRQQDQGEAKGTTPWYATTYNAADWKTMKIPGYWADQGLGPVNGVVWLRKEVEVPASMVGKPARLELGTIVDSDSVYINGQFAGTTGYQYPPRKYDLPATLLKPGRNLIVVRVINNSGKGGFTLDKQYRLTAGGQTLDLRGDWQYKLGAASQPAPGSTTFQYQPGGLFNGMIAPLLPYSIKGVLWYQGESNTSKPEEYQQLLTALIADWRTHWKQPKLPFIYAQLPNFMAVKEQPSESEWARLRESQRRTLAVPNTAMSVNIDLGEWNDIHPLAKEDVAKRLALAAEKVAYGESKIVSSGPLYQGMQVAGNKATLTFTNTGSGLVAKGGGPLKRFAVAGADNKFVWANARIEGNKVIVWSEQVATPVTVRYAWADNPEGANLYNKEGLPASPFTTAK